MKIVHRISLTVTPETVKRLQAYGVDVDTGLVTFEVSEDHPRWLAIADLARTARAVDVVSTKASRQELTAASWLQMRPAWHHGYPQPEHNGGYLLATYDLTDYCDVCGLGAIQKQPFRLKGEPNWGRRSILQLNWIFDEYFVHPDAWDAVLKPLGVESRPVLNSKTDTPLATVLQIQIDRLADVAVTKADQYRCCPRCERRKYFPIVRGCFPGLINAGIASPILKSTAYFGDGASAFRAVLIPAAVHAGIAGANLLGASFLPACQGDERVMWSPKAPVE